MATLEPVIAGFFRDWFTAHNGEFNADALFTEVQSGFSVVAGKDLAIDTTIAKCPFDLVISEELAKTSLIELFNVKELVETNLWSHRQWIASYLCFHWIVKGSSRLHHYAYVESLPSIQKLRTPLHFSELELQVLKGTNLYGATLDREKEWRNEWVECQTTFTIANSEWGGRFSWELYLTASTHLSSRAFPSSLLSPKPSLTPLPDTKPVLIPGVDALNHARGQPVSWVVTYPDANVAISKSPSISLVHHKSAVTGEELFNNYGVKPNSELILGYGFSLPQNPDDTIVLKLGGLVGERWEVGRSARGANGLWNEILHQFLQDHESPPEYEDQLDAAAALLDMVHSLLDRLPSEPDIRKAEVRPDVETMLHNYLEGQRDILHSLIDFAHEKERLALEAARNSGVDIVLED